MTGTHAVLLPVGAEIYAVPIDWVLEVVAVPPVTPLVTAPSVVLGLFNLRGQIVPLLDTAALLGVGAVGAVAFVAVVQTPHGLAGLATTGLPQRVVLTERTGASDLPGASGVYRLDRLVVVLLDPALVLTPDRIGGRERDVPRTTAVGLWPH